jgi:hypothetical protein
MGKSTKKYVKLFVCYTAVWLIDFIQEEAKKAAALNELSFNQ